MEINLKDTFFARIADGRVISLKYVRDLGNGVMGCVEADNTHMFHSVTEEDVVTRRINPETGEAEYFEEEIPYDFEVDRSYFIYEPEKGEGGEGEGDDENENDEGEGENEKGEGDESDKGDQGDEEGDQDGEKQKGDAEDGQPTDEPGDAGQAEKGDGEGYEASGESDGNGEAEGEGQEAGADNGERNGEGEGNEIAQQGERATIIKAAEHPDQIISETVAPVRKKNRF